MLTKPHLLQPNPNWTEWPSNGLTGEHLPRRLIGYPEEFNASWVQVVGSLEVNG